MEKLLYIALIDADDGIHIFNKKIEDPHGEYEDFEEWCNNKALSLGGDLFGPYAVTDIVEHVSLPDGPCNPEDAAAAAYTDQPYTPEEEAELDQLIRDAHKALGIE